jgi:hypothetical protein
MNGIGPFAENTPVDGIGAMADQPQRLRQLQALGKARPASLSAVEFEALEKRGVYRADQARRLSSRFDDPAVKNPRLIAPTVPSLFGLAGEQFQIWTAD